MDKYNVTIIAKNPEKRDYTVYAETLDDDVVERRGCRLCGRDTDHEVPRLLRETAEVINASTMVEVGRGALFYRVLKIVEESLVPRCLECPVLELPDEDN